ncbi:MAG: glycoside hydrolase family 3 C-terminal domain-containing protein [Anaerolineae bacterium]|nr:glycoside hydrolase family 3 C-terminal domain-containing protein [Anaerolineae bacterium]
MTLEEKAALCTGASPWRTVGIERLGLEPIVLSDGPHGLRRASEIDSMMVESLPATCFPVAATLSSSWDVELAGKLGQAIAEEAIDIGVDIVLGPGMNIKRSPLCGRNFEYFSEDPLLAGKMAAGLIEGMQSKGVGACVKHFAVNNQETRRFTVDAVVDERTLHEIYLAGFELAIRSSKPWTVMCSYNSVNGTFAAENHYLLTEVLRDQWDFEGFVMSDWGAVHDRPEGVKAGLDLEMPGPSPDRTQAVIDAVNSGDLDMATLDTVVERLLKVILHAQETPKGGGAIDVEGHHALARSIAADCMVMLKNEDGVLPLEGNERIAVIGQAARMPVFQGGGSSHINTTKVDNALEFLRQRSEVQYAIGDASVELNQEAIDEAVVLANNADVALLFIALPESVESEGYDRPNLYLTPQQVALIHAVAAANPRVVVILNNGSAIDMHSWINDVDAIIEAWLPGQAGAGAVVDILFGDVNPSGKLGETFPIKLSDTPCHLNFPGEKDTVHYGEGIYVGYRGYDAMERDVLFPFGFGLSYTQFEYSNLSVSTTNFKLGQPLTVTLDVTNVGYVAGKEIVQLYVSDVESRLPRPIKELKAFAKVALEPGETKQVTLTLDDRAFMFYDPDYGQWLAEAGTFDLLVGASSADIRLTAQVNLTEGSAVASLLHVYSTLKDWMSDPKGAEIVKPMIDNFASQAMGDAEALGVDSMLVFFQDLPLTQVLRFTGAGGSESPDKIVQALVDKVHA